MTYAGCGVNYKGLDAFKKLCRKRAEMTDRNASRFGITVEEETRGESVLILSGLKATVFGHVEEGLGTKNLVADAWARITGQGWYGPIAQDTVAMIVNDLATLGLQPITLAMQLAVANGDWFLDEARAVSLINGWGDACDLSGCVWVGGETPALKDIICPGAALLAGSACGIAAYPEIRINQDQINPGDVIIGLPSSGIHANGLTMARSIADQLPKGYETTLPSGIAYGEALLQPTYIYSSFMEHCLKHGVRIGYCANVTGHGFRKIMRAERELTYVIDWLPKRPEIFDFIMEHGPVALDEMFKTLNAGIGYVLIMSAAEWRKIEQMIKDGYQFISSLPYQPCRIGYVEEGPRRVVIEPENLEFAGETLSIR